MKEAEKSSTLVLPASSPREFGDSLVPAEENRATVFCDNYYKCPDGTTCCRSPSGAWSCCPYSAVSPAAWALSLEDPVKAIIHSQGINHQGKSANTSTTDKNVVTGQLLFGWLPLLSHGLPLWRYLHALHHAEPQISFSSQRTALCIPGCPHCPPRGKKHVAGGMTYIIAVNVYVTNKVSYIYSLKG